MFQCGNLASNKIVITINYHKSHEMYIKGKHGGFILKCVTGNMCGRPPN